MVVCASWQFRGKIKKVIEIMVGKSLHGSDNEYLVNVAFAFAYTVNLAYRYIHSFS